MNEIHGQNSGRLKFVPFAEPLVERVAFVTHDSAHVSPTTPAMIKMAADHLRRLGLKPKHYPPQHITTQTRNLPAMY
jgi:hypothetical protein